MGKVDLSLKQFAAGSCILINDVVTGARKLGEVLEGGTSYKDLSDGGPLLTYQNAVPEAVGNSLSWAQEATSRGFGEQYTALETRMLDAGVDRFVMMRALFWAVQNNNYDYVAAHNAGYQQTELVREGRERAYALIAKAAQAGEGA